MPALLCTLPTLRLQRIDPIPDVVKRLCKVFGLGLQRREFKFPAHGRFKGRPCPLGPGRAGTLPGRETGRVVLVAPAPAATAPANPTRCEGHRSRDGITRAQSCPTSCHGSKSSWSGSISEWHVSHLLPSFLVRAVVWSGLVLALSSLSTHKAKCGTYH